MTFFIDFKFFEERKIEGKLITLERAPLSVNPEVIVYMIPSEVSCLESIFFQVQNHKSTNTKKKYIILFTPKITFECQKYLDSKQQGLLFDIQLFSFPIEMFPIDYDIISLEMNSFSYLNPSNYLSDIHKSVSKLESIYGKLKYSNIFAKGDCSVKLSKLINDQEAIFETENILSGAIILDRSIDFITPLCTVNTYEGLIDEYFDISLNTIKNNDFFGKEQNRVLSSKNEFYEKWRDTNYGHLRNTLPTKFQELVQIMQNERNNDVADMKAISEGLERFKKAQIEFQPCKVHIDIATAIKEKHDVPIMREFLRKEQPMLNGDLPEDLENFYEMVLYQQKNFYSIMKILCLESLIFSGVRSKMYDIIKRDILLVS